MSRERRDARAAQKRRRRRDTKKQLVLATASASPTIAICRAMPPAGDCAASMGGPLEPDARG